MDVIDVAEEPIYNSIFFDKFHLRTDIDDNGRIAVIITHPTNRMERALLYVEASDGVVTVRKTINRTKHKINLLDPEIDCCKEMHEQLEATLDDHFMDLARTEYFRRCAANEGHNDR